MSSYKSKLVVRAAAISGKLMHCRRAPQSVARFWRYEALITITHLSQRPSILHVHRDVGNKIITQLFHSFFCFCFLMTKNYACVRAISPHTKARQIKLDSNHTLRRHSYCYGTRLDARAELLLRNKPTHKRYRG